MGNEQMAMVRVSRLSKSVGRGAALAFASLMTLAAICGMEIARGASSQSVGKQHLESVLGVHVYPGAQPISGDAVFHAHGIAGHTAFGFFQTRATFAQVFDFYIRELGEDALVMNGPNDKSFSMAEFMLPRKPHQMYATEVILISKDHRTTISIGPNKGDNGL